MKILVYNYQHQYALSRKQIEAIKAILPNTYFAPIKTFHITHSKVGQEIFEYNSTEKMVHFAFPVIQKESSLISDAVIELLIGLARIKANTRWGYFISEQERSEYQDFVDKWYSKCITAIS